ncbi:MAG: Dodecaprenyl-phosphate galacturonate synthase [bacterium]|nr:Dodecaprenyl-phosphate galacturonate synthase [bacterium]
MSSTPPPHISVVVPAFNEEGNLERLHTGLAATLEATGKPYEVLFVDDGSTDGTFAVIRKLAAEDPRVSGIRLRKNMGKSNALAAGFEAARGLVVITMDGDNQDDPAEIPRFLAKLDEGFDLVSGWKKVRQDPSSRVRASHLFNWAVRKISGIPLHDFNCGFKAYRAEVVKAVPLYGEWHRFIPVLASDLGFRIAEVEVVHHPRTHGKSRYGFERYFRAFADCLSMLILSRYAERPGHLLTGVGFALFFLGLVTRILFYFGGSLEAGGLMRFAGAFLSGLMPIGVSFILVGMLAELIVSKSPPQRFRTAIAERVGQAIGEGSTAERDYPGGLSEDSKWIGLE